MDVGEDMVVRTLVAAKLEFNVAGRHVVFRPGGIKVYLVLTDPRYLADYFAFY